MAYCSLQATPLRRTGYTLIELLVVLAVLGILASVAMPLAEVGVQRDKERQLRRALWEIRDAIDGYRQARESGAFGIPGESTCPPDLMALTQAQPDQRPDQQGRVWRFLRRVPRDPFADPTLPPERSWGQRSYQSEASNPRPGDDVYDVYSTSTKMGLNGVPLRLW